jgi:predicted DNA-binding protein with PD1-like motif
MGASGYHSAGGESVLQATNGREAVVRLADGEDLVGSLRGLAVDGAIIACGIGMVRALRIGFWNGASYEESQIEDPAELLSLQGTIAASADGRAVHCHVSVATHDGSVRGGHLLGATVANTAEIGLLLVPGIHLERRLEPTGLTGLVPSAEGGARP